MVLFEDGTWMRDFQFPNIDFTDGKAKYVIPDDTELAYKIQSFSVVDFVCDLEGNLIDVKEKISIYDEFADIESQLNEIDFQTIAPLRAILTGNSTAEDELKLQELESQASKLRSQLTVVKRKMEKAETGTNKSDVIEAEQQDTSLWK